LTVKSEKVKLAVHKISFIEHNVSPNGIRIDAFGPLYIPSWGEGGYLLHWYGQFVPSVRPEFLGTGRDIK